MRYLHLTCLVFLSLFAVNLKAATLPQDLNWLSGSWLSKGQAGIFEENWSRNLNNQLLGSARFIKHNGSATFFELMTLTRKDKQWEMQLMHFGRNLSLMHQKPLVYRLVAGNSKELVFKNQGNDAIQYINYLHPDSKTLLISLKTQRNTVKKQFKLYKTAPAVVEVKPNGQGLKSIEP